MTESRSRRARVWARRLGVLAFAVGSLLFLAVVSGLDKLASMEPAGPGVAAGTTGLMMACGAALALLSGKRDGRRGEPAARLLAGAAALASAATLAVHAAGYDGTIGPHTAAAFLLLGASLALLGNPRKSWRGAARAMAAAGGGVAVVAGLGHLFEFGEYYGEAALMPHREMALPTAFVVLLLSAGALLEESDEGFMRTVTDEGSGGMAARRLLVGMWAFGPMLVAIAAGVRLGWYGVSTAAALGVFLAFLEGSFFILDTAQRLRHIEDLKRVSDRRLHASEERYHRLIEHAPDAIFIADKDGLFTEVNAAGCRLLGYARKEILRMSIPELLPERDRARFESAFDLLTEQGSGIGEWTLVRKDGRELPAEVSTKIYPDGLRESFVRDVSERQRLAKVKDEVIALTSHELQNPLSTIYAATRMLLSGDAGPLPEKAVEFLTLSRDASQRMVRIIRDFLTVERLGAGRLELKKEPVALGPLLQDVITSVELASGTGRRVALTPTDETLISDRDRLMEVVVNLVSNALKFSPPGEPVEVSAERRGDAIRVSVRDHGPGISDEFRGRIFQRFARDRSTGAPGTGLGLSISKAIVEGLGGRIGFDTEPGEGTTFYFELPASEPPAAG